MRFSELPWRSFPEFFLDYPWAADLVGWLQIAKDWVHRYESILILVGLWLVARKIRRERERLEERVNTLSQHVQAATDASDAAIVKAQQAANTIVTAIAKFGPAMGSATQVVPEATLQAAEGDYANWQRISEIWSNLKQRIDLRIEDIPNKRMREKYSHIDRRTYRNIITKLEQDGVLGAAVADTLRDLARRYQALKFSPAGITAAQVERFVEGQQIINASRDLGYVLEQDNSAMSTQSQTQAHPSADAARQTAA